MAKIKFAPLSASSVLLLCVTSPTAASAIVISLDRASGKFSMGSPVQFTPCERQAK